MKGKKCDDDEVCACVFICKYIMNAKQMWNPDVS